MTPMCFERIVLCDACGSEGLLYHGDPDDGWIEDCPYCEGTGGEIISTEPIDEDDLEIYAPLTDRVNPL